LRRERRQSPLAEADAEHAKAKTELLQVRIEEKYLAAPNVIGVIVGQKTFPSLRAKRSNPSHHGENMDCFVARSSR